ncbi:glycoside hydrolase family 43 protein [Clavulina sp. PMI_390]|nr:glycoside hydrolase family 43 protein [Clavulina sp. PMI_390]
MLRSYLSVLGLALLAAASPVAKRSISSPIFNTNFPDPAWIQVGSQYYAFSTTNAGLHVPMATSPDFNTWTLKSGYDALPKVGAWSTGNAVWAPDVVQLANGLYIMYYSAESTAKAANGASAHCFGAASSTVPQGPYTPVGDAIQCHLDQGGAIDPAGFQDSNGRQYIVYKIDGNNMGAFHFYLGNCNNGVAPIHSTPIMLQEVDPSNGWSRIGNPVQILDRSDADGPLVEAPSLTHVADSAAAGGYLYILFFSSNCYAGGLYDSSYATSVNGVAGPYTKSSAPLLVTGTDGLYSPGGLDVGPGGAKVMFHADQSTSADVRLTRTGAITINVGGRTVSI